MGRSGALKSAARLKEKAAPIVSGQARVSGRKAVVLFLLLMAIFIGVQLLLPLSTAVKIGADEGFETAKATLSLNGYRFYTEVWNDQPPLHTFLLTSVLERVSYSILAARLLTVLFAILLLAGVFWSVFRLHGPAIAAMATLWVIGSPGFIELSCSAMQEVPALAPVVAALCLLLVTGPDRWRLSEVVPGMVFAFGLQMKLIGVIYLPLVAFILWHRHRREEKSGREKVGRTVWRLFSSPLCRSALVFAVSLVAAFVAIDWLTERGAYLKHFQQSWTAHFAAVRSFEHGSPAEHGFEWDALLKNWDATLPTLLGLIVLARQARKRPILLLPGLWLLWTLVVFAVHKPWWSYYYVHHAIPLGWCAAAGIGALWGSSASGRKGRIALLTAALLITLTWMGARVGLQVRDIRNSPQLYTELVLPEIERLKPFTTFLYTDEPIYSFHTGIPLPPKLGVISLKRFWSGDLTTAGFVEELQAAEPGLILLGNAAREVPYSDWLHAEYRLIFEDSERQLYGRRSVLTSARQSGARP